MGSVLEGVEEEARDTDEKMQKKTQLFLMEDRLYIV